MYAPLDAIARLFSTDGSVPGRASGPWPDWLVREHLAGNALVWLACLALPPMIWRLGARRRGWTPFRGVARAFALFIGLCGLGHFLDMIAFFRPMHRLSGHVLAATGLVSWWTAWSLRKAWPAFVAMKSPAEREREVAERTEELTRLVDELRGAEVDRAYLATIVESSQDAIVSEDLDGIIISWNAGAERLFGYEAAEAVGRPITFLLAPDRLDEESAILGRLRRGERADHCECVRLTRDGRSIDVSLTISPIKDRSGRIIGLSKIARDITEKKRAEESLARSEGRFRQLAESIPQLAWMARPDGHLFWYNRRWYDYTGTTPGEMEGWGWRSVHDPEMLPAVLERWSRSIAEGEPFEMVLPIRGGDGQFRKFLTRVLPSRDAEGRVLGWFGTNTDIDEQSRAEEALRVSEGRLRHVNENLERLVGERTAELGQQARLIDQAHDAILIRSEQGVISSWNQGAERLYGWTRGEALGHASHDLLKTLFPKPLAEIEADLATLGSWEGELVHQARDGSRVVVASRWIVDRDRSADLAVMEINSDVTGRKEAERELLHSRDAAMAATRAKGEFLANMSHEIRTPMNGVVGLTELLLDTRLDDIQRGYAEAVRSSGEALLTVINDILDFSKIEAGKLTLEATEFDLRALMEEVTELLAPGALRKNLEIHCRVAREVPGRLVGDPVRIRQVLTNLAGNAVKFTESGAVDLEAHPVDGDDGGGGEGRVALRVLVRDTGIGIPADRQADVFESFTQIDGGNSRRHGGTGLGLAICRSLVALMGGRIGVESCPGRGSTFWFEVALARASGVEDVPEIELAGLRVLVVVDRESDREALREMLVSWGCLPEAVGSGAGALARLLAGPDPDPFRLILLDQDLPGMDGEQTARVIRAAFRGAEVPLVLITSPGRSGAAEGEDGLWAARMPRPVRRSWLYNALCRVVATPGSARDRPPADRAEGGKLPSPLRILLVEDNRINQLVAVGLAERLGCTVEAAWNGREALEALDRGEYDLVLMDVQMPVMDGFAATAAIRDRERGTGRHIPIVAMTAHAMLEDRQRCLDAGMDDYLSKPIRSAPLQEALLAWGGKIQPGTIGRGRGPGPEPPTSFADGLRASCGGDPGLIRKVVGLMLEDVPARLGRLEAAVVARDGRRVAWEAHNLKGAFAMVGADALAEACQGLMTLGEGGDFAAIAEVLRPALIRWERLKEEANLHLSTGIVVPG